MNELIFSEIFKNEKFYIYFATGGALSPYMTFSPEGADGKAVNDSVNISDRECAVASYDGSFKRFAPWADIGKGHTRAGAKAILWDGPFRYWCVADMRRPNNKWHLSAKVYTPKKNGKVNINPKVGDYLAVLQGQISIDGVAYPNFSIVDITDNKSLVADATEDSVVFVITARKP